MKKFTFTGAATAAAITLSACGGGGGSDPADDAEVGGVSGITSAEAISRFASLNEGFVNVSADTVLQTDLPPSGVVAYEGDLGFDVRGALPGGGTEVDASIVGDLNLSVNFGTDAISGDVTNLLYADTDGNFDRPTGTLNVVGGIVSLPRNGLPDLGGVISADADGTLAIDQGDGVDKNVVFDLDLSGQFGGVGDVSGTKPPEALRGFVIGSGSGGGLTLTAPNGRFAADTATAGIVD